MRKGCRYGKRRAAAVTLLEVLVAVAAGAVVLAIALGILVTTNQAANRSLAHESVLQQSQLAMKEIRAVVEAVVWPEDLATTMAASSLRFAKDELIVLSSHRPTTGGLFCLYRFSNKTEKTGGRGEKVRAVAGYERIEPQTRRMASPFQEFGKEFNVSLSFRYATEIGPGLQPVWQDSLADGQRPRLIWIDLLVRNEDVRDQRGQPEEVRLTTAISL
ncbi:MAG: prepilin-type N-terminal cleavage/methylation domain-containing protein [Candidatus Sumerlaeia bacterium]|nr:prepilin-type N-terminal cleavage/methylation domain-containing protein [Candidatus Sumerlaeia bacterium]